MHNIVSSALIKHVYLSLGLTSQIYFWSLTWLFMIACYIYSRVFCFTAAFVSSMMHCGVFLAVGAVLSVWFPITMRSCVVGERCYWQDLSWGILSGVVPERIISFRFSQCSLVGNRKTSQFIRRQPRNYSLDICFFFFFLRCCALLYGLLFLCSIQPRLM